MPRKKTLTVRGLRRILALYDEDAPVYVELNVEPGPFIAVGIAGESGISVTDEDGVLYLATIGTLELRDG